MSLRATPTISLPKLRQFRYCHRSRARSCRRAFPCFCLLRAQLSQRTEPVLEVIGASDLAVSDGLDVDRHDPKALARMRHTEEIAGRCPADLAAHDDSIAGDEDFLDVELHVGDRLGEATDDFDRVLTPPALAGQIAPARLVVGGEDLLLERAHIALNRLVEQRVPGRDRGARLPLRETLRRRDQWEHRGRRGNDDLADLCHPRSFAIQSLMYGALLRSSMPLVSQAPR